MNKLTKRLLLTASLLVVLMPLSLGLGRQIGSYSYWRKIADITREVNSPDKKAAAETALLKIVLDQAANVHLRRFAVEKLGELGSIEVAEPIKVLAERLPRTGQTGQLKKCASLAYWQIKVRQEKTSEAQEDLLIKLLWGKNHPPPHADVIPWWAAEELANRGIQRALPEIEKSITYRNSTTRAKQFIRLCSVKIDLLNSSPMRLEALRRALENQEEPLVGRSLRRWAVAELGRLGSGQARAVLINHALSLQDDYYDQQYRPKGKLVDGAYMDAADCYNLIIAVLKEAGMDQQKLRSFGLQPERCFVMAP